MKISILTPCYLGPYKQAGSDRERKLLRCVNSVMYQEPSIDIEQIIIADGCKRTIELIQDNFPTELKDGLIKLYEIEKQKPFSGIPRNVGLQKAKGDWIVYLDSDDIFGPDHLEYLQDSLRNWDWVFFNDMVWNGQYWQERFCQITPFQCGTSNIAHRRAMAARWDLKNDYGKDDYKFILKLKAESSKWTKVETPEYIVCHIPKQYDL